MHERIPRAGRLFAFGFAIATAIAPASCVDTFAGSQIELYLNGGAQVPGDTPSGDGRPPSDTHYEIYVVRDNSPFHIVDFEINPLINLSDPCFIEIDRDRFPGLHSTKIVDKVTQVSMADGVVTADEAGDIATAEARRGTMPALAGGLKVMSAHEPLLTNAVIAQLEAGVPDINLIDDASNAQRLAACKAIWKAHPGFYVGTDKIITIPLNGTYYGMVAGMDPRNNSAVGGAAVRVDDALPTFDAMRINWNFNDPNDPRKSSYGPSTIGWHYMAGTPYMRTRDVINVTMKNDDFVQLSGEAAILTNLDEDDVHF